MKLFTPLAICGLAALSIQAQASVVSERTIGQQLAAEIVSAAVASCSAQGYQVSATVVDRAGNVQAVLRADNAGPHTLDSSRRKAYTSASLKAPTAKVLENVQKNAAAQNLTMIDDLLILAGGLPIKVGDEVVGGLGIGGAPGGHLDEQCGIAALDSLKAKLN